MSNARTLADIINSNSQIVVPSGGVNFGTSTDGSGTVTGGILDDYEEGTFGGSITNGTYYGYYIKVGNLVTLNGVVYTTSSHSGYVGNITAPFAIKSGYYAAVSVCGVINPYNHEFLGGVINSGSPTIIWFGNSGGNGINVTNTTDSGAFQFSASYMVE